MVKRFCDRCGKELPPDTRQNVKIGTWVVAMQLTPTWKNFYYDMCSNCCDGMMKFIGAKGEEVDGEEDGV